MIASGCIILGRDFNVPLDPLQDTSNSRSSLSYRILKKIRTLLNKLTLKETWRVTHPQEKDYTYFSMVHNEYSRIDFVFITQRDLNIMMGAHIGTRTISDHALTSLTLQLQNTPKRQGNWRLNLTLLTDLVTLEPIAEAIKTYFRENSTEEVSHITVWKAHKCMLRGRLISLASLKKKNSEKELQVILDRVQKLETQHKRSSAI